MRHGRTRLLGAAVASIAATAMVGITALPRLPAEMAIHFSASGDAGNYVPRPVGIAVVPVGMLLTLVVLEGAARIDPPGDQRTFDVTVLATMALLAGAQVYVVAWNLGYRIPPPVALLSVVLWGGAIGGYALVRHGGGE